MAPSGHRTRDELGFLVQIFHATLLTNHVGYDLRAPKIAILQTHEPLAPARFEVARAATDEPVLEGRAAECGHVDGWKGRAFQVLDFSALAEPGAFVVKATLPGKVVARSLPVEVGEHRLLGHTLSDVIYYYLGQRHTGPLAEADRRATYLDRPGETADVRGGWCDATADWSKNLSHLDHALYMNPQQAPLPVWTMTLAAERLAESGVPAEGLLRGRLLEEAAWGADFLARMQEADGCFREMAILRRSGDAMSTQIGYNTYGMTPEMLPRYRCGWRQGAGMAVAALARCAALGLAGDFSPAAYLRRARRGFDYAERHGAAHLWNGRENIIDDYCALLAAAELYAAAPHPRYLEAARQRTAHLAARLCDTGPCAGWLRADDAGERPWFHASDEGMPLVALLRYAQVEPNAARRDAAYAVLGRMLEFQTRLSGAAHGANPFRYARQWVRRAPGLPPADRPMPSWPVRVVPESARAPHAAFFLPHDNETGYWWQGENARIASLAAAWLWCALDRPELADRGGLVALAQGQLDWILGLNPFDACMLHGRGRNNPEYTAAIPNAPGGICNGITADPDDERDIALLSGPHAADGRFTWRWGEQWLPHTAWFLLAVTLRDRAMA